MTNSLPPSPSPSPHRCTRRRGEMSPLIALALAGGIAAIIAVGVAAYSNDTRNDAKVDAYYNELVYVASQMQQRYSKDYTRFGGWSGSAARMASLKMVPAENIIAGNAVTPWNGEMQMQPINTTTFRLMVRHTGLSPVVPVDACTAILNRFSGRSYVAAFASPSTTISSNTVSFAQANMLCSDNIAAIDFN